MGNLNINIPLTREEEAVFYVAYAIVLLIVFWVLLNRKGE